MKEHSSLLTYPFNKMNVTWRFKMVDNILMQDISLFVPTFTVYIVNEQLHQNHPVLFPNFQVDSFKGTFRVLRKKGDKGAGVTDVP